MTDFLMVSPPFLLATHAKLRLRDPGHSLPPPWPARDGAPTQPATAVYRQSKLGVSSPDRPEGTIMFSSNAAAKAHGIATCALAAALFLLGGCASNRLDAEWTDPQFKGRSLRGTKVFVVCETPEPAIRLNCEQQMAAQVTAAGATPIKPDATDAAQASQPQAAEQNLAAAR